MTKHKSLTNQELLKQLEERLSSFTQDEFVTLGRLISEHRQRFMRIIQTGNPRVYNWIQEQQKQLEQEENDNKLKKLKKSLSEK